LPPIVVAALGNLPMAENRTLFGLTKSGYLYDLLNATQAKAGVEIPKGVKFHIFRHTFGAWMRRYAKLDTSGLVATGAWKSRQAAAIYEHVDVTVEASKADLLPRAKTVGQ